MILLLKKAVRRENTVFFAYFLLQESAVGADCHEGPPVPIPNTVVKLVRAENTCLATDWENK